MISVFIDYLWLKRPSLYEENNILYKLIKDMNEHSSIFINTGKRDFFFTILVPLSSAIRPTREGLLIHRDTVKFVIMEGTDYGHEYKKNEEYGIKNIYENLDHFNEYNFFPHPNNKQKTPELYWKDWDCDLVISFNPIDFLDYYDHFYDKTRMEPFMICIITENYLKVLSKKDYGDRLIMDSYFNNGMPFLQRNYYDIGSDNKHNPYKNALFIFENSKCCEKFAEIMIRDEEGYISGSGIGEVFENTYIVHDDDSYGETIVDEIELNVIKIINEKHILKKENSSYNKAKSFIKKKGIISKRELFTEMGWGKNFKFRKYRNKLRVDNNIRIIGNNKYQWIDPDVVWDEYLADKSLRH